MEYYFWGLLLLIIAYLHRVFIEWAAWWGLRGWLYGSRRPTCVWLSDVSWLYRLHGTSCQRLLIGFRSTDWTGKGRHPYVVLALPVGDEFGTMTWLTVIQKQKWCWNSIYAGGTMHLFIMPTYFVTSTVSSTMFNFAMSLAAPDHDLQNVLLHCHIQALRFEFL